MAKKESIEVTRDRIFYAVEELTGLVPTDRTASFLDTWGGLMRYQLTELQQAVEAYTFAAEDEARELQQSQGVEA